MGDQNVSNFTNTEERKLFTKNLLNDLHTLERMIDNDMIESDIVRIGAEQEMTLIGQDWYPSMNYDEVLKEINDPHFTTELARFNLEANLDPQKFEGNALRKMHKQLDLLLNKVRQSAEKFDTRVLLTGILPTIRSSFLDFQYMTPNPRYKLLNDVMVGKRKAKFEMNIKGLDELIYQHSNILFEACNTSFQVHLQVSPKEFKEKYNWAQAIAGPVMAIAANSPVLMGRRLWKETRIALFQQSIDTRNSGYIKRDKEPRVYFGKDWIKKSVTEIYQYNISRFESLFTSSSSEMSIDQLNRGETPQLNALCLHSGSVYSWNRVCYGISDTGLAHLRIENRYLPSGPTTIDEMANTAFWLGLMNGMPETYKNIDKFMSFEDARFNFYNAARVGIESNFRWMGDLIPLKKLLVNYMIPWAKEGLQKVNIKQEDIDKYLGVIEERVNNKVNGATWTLNNFSEYLKVANPREASVNLTRALYNNSITNNPVHTWANINPNLGDGHKHFYKVGHLMNTDIPTVMEGEIVELAINIMVWRNLRYVVVENHEHEVVGLIASRVLIKLLKNGWNDSVLVDDIMEKNLITVHPEIPSQEAIDLMVENNIGCLPVVIKRNRLVGLLTERDVVKATHLTQKFKKES